MLFIKKFVTEPRTIGSVTPSSPQLADSMLCHVDWKKIKAIAELGAGTGVMTRAIMERMDRASELLVFEIDEELRARLRGETGLEIYDDACLLPKVMSSRGVEKEDLIVSRVPFTVIPSEAREHIVDGVSRSLAPEGVFVAFQYSLHMKSTFEKLFKHVDTRFVMMNVPPAFVYECRGVKG